MQLMSTVSAPVIQLYMSVPFDVSSNFEPLSAEELYFSGLSEGMELFSVSTTAFGRELDAKLTHTSSR